MSDWLDFHTPARGAKVYHWEMKVPGFEKNIWVFLSERHADTSPPPSTPSKVAKLSFFGPKRCVMFWNVCKSNFPELKKKFVQLHSKLLTITLLQKV